MKSLVAWPDAAGADYRDSGEGGLWAYAVWELPHTECHVETEPLMPPGDVLLHVEGPLEEHFRLQEKELAESYCFPLDDDFNYDEMAYKSLMPFGTAVFLGSTSASLYSDREGRYFRVTPASMTGTGVTLLATLSGLYESEPTIVTYLDT